MPRRNNDRNLTVKHAIEDSGFTQQEIADACKVTANHVNKVVLGDRRSPRVEQFIKQITGVDVASVFNSNGVPA